MKHKVINLFKKNTIVVENKGVKYSELLKKFLEPFVHEFKHIEFYEDIIEIGIFAWNIANLKILLPDEDFKNILESNKYKKEDVKLINKMVDYKKTHFKNYLNFMVDYELKQTNNDPILSIITQQKDDYLAEMLNDSEYENNEDDFEDNYINRQAIILKPKQPFIDWCVSFCEDELEDIKETRTYLLDEDIDDIEQWLRKKYDKLFKFELETFQFNKKEWPQRRNYKMFKEWFWVDFSTMIFDFEKKPVSKYY